MDIDAELMLRFKQGDVSSFEKLMRKYKEQVVNIIYRFIGDRDEAEDLAIKEKARALSEVPKIEGVFEGLLVIYFRCQR